MIGRVINYEEIFGQVHQPPSSYLVGISREMLLKSAVFLLDFRGPRPYWELLSNLFGTHNKSFVDDLVARMALVKSLVQRLNERAGWGLPLEDRKGLHIEAERVFQGFVGKVKLAVQVEVLPADGRTGGDGIGHRPALGRRGTGGQPAKAVIFDRCRQFFDRWPASCR